MGSFPILHTCGTVTVHQSGRYSRPVVTCGLIDTLKLTVVHALKQLSPYAPICYNIHIQILGFLRGVISAAACMAFPVMNSSKSLGCAPY